MFARRPSTLALALAALAALTALAGCDDDSTEAVDAAPAADAAVDLGSAPDAMPDAMPDASTDPDAASTSDLGADLGPDAGPALEPVGYHVDELTYTPEGEAEPRTIPVFWWYPAAEAGERTPRYRLFRPDDAFTDAPPAVEPGAPLMVFSHGRAGFAQYSYFIAHHYARRGWIVVAADHIGDTVSDAVDSTEIYFRRPQDISRLIDRALDAPAGHLLAGLAGDTVVVVGHSFGGYTALAVAGADYAVDKWTVECTGDAVPSFCGDDFATLAPLYTAGFADPRVDLAVPLAPGNYSAFDEGLAAVEIPVLMMTGDRDRSTTDEGSGDPIWAALPDEPRNRRVRFHAGGHFTFTHLCGFIGQLGVMNGCDDDNTPPADAHAVVLAYMDASIDLHLDGDTAGQPLLDGAVELHPEVTIAGPGDE